VLFPEGTRSPDGKLQAIKPGFCAIAKRAGVPLVPVAMDGSYDAWPRKRRFPRRSVIHVQFGQPLAPAEIEPLSDEELVREVERRLHACFEKACQDRRRASGGQRVKPAS
jgi:1-acyl-sn-glycerol-3-phosphate acyltransferase